MIQQKENITNIINQKAKIVGNVNIDGSIRVDGYIKGNVIVTDLLVLGKTGTIEGNIKTKDAIVGGTIIGEITCSAKAEFQNTSKIKGDICCKSLIIEEGTVFDGHCNMEEGKPSGQKTSTK
ncbi:polymer-forming cytoskeletal protein [candidate division WOR-3 bacterium]|jgi:cytoskeletal protein CcmA (bactofilin family)|nr:polymer-forming cytoskeletal protein [candidate division WOR-3 bacterium]